MRVGCRLGWAAVGDAEYALIGGPVKQLEEHILARIWPISLEAVLRYHHTSFTEEEKKTFLLWAHVPHYSSTLFLTQQWQGQLSSVFTFVHPRLILLNHVPPKSLCLVSLLSQSTLGLANDRLLRIRRIKSRNVLLKSMDTKDYVCQLDDN